MGIDLYFIPVSGPCRAVRMTARLLNIHLNEKLVDLMAKEQLKPEFIQMNPQHCVPTIDDNGFVLWESRAILTYLVNKYAPGSPLYPQDPQARAIVDRMLYFDIGTLFKAEYEYMVPMALRGEPEDPEKKAAFEKTLVLLEGFLNKTPYVAGHHLTLADISLIASISSVDVCDFTFDAYPRISAWMARMKAEIPDFKQLNEDPISQFKQKLKSKK